MKYLLYVVLLAWFFIAQAQDKVFNPVEKKAEFCQQLEDVKSNLSCEGESCSPLYESSVSLPLQWMAVKTCSFECVVGQQMCDMSLHPDYEGFYGYDTYADSSHCSDSSDADSFDVDRSEVYYRVYYGEEIKHIEEVKTHKETGCEEWTIYVEICSEDGSCKEIEKHSDEWFEYERQQQLKVYEESCFIPTEDDCKNVEQEMRQCVSDIANTLSESLCAPSTDSLWLYRKHGPNLGPGPTTFKRSHKLERSTERSTERSYEYEKTEEAPTPSLEESLEGYAEPSE